MIKKSLTLLSVLALLVSSIGVVDAHDGHIQSKECGDDSYRQEPEESSGGSSDQLLEYVRVTSPNGGEILGRNAGGYVMTTLLPLDKHQITWESLSTRVKKVDILYSLDFGTNYISIADGIDNTGYFNWLLPNTDSDQALIRINAHGPAGENLGSDRSNSPFIIRNYLPSQDDVSTSSSEYAAMYVANSEPGAVSPGQTFSVNVTYKNVGSATWYKYSDFPVHLGTAVPNDRGSVFFNSSWLITDMRPAMLMEDMVEPGQVGTFMFTMTAPMASGDYHEVFTPVVEGLTWMYATSTFDIIVS